MPSKLLLHLTAIAVTGALTLFALLPVATILELHRFADLRSVAVHSALSASIWFLTFFSVRRLTKTQRTPRIHRIARGSVMTETLIVMPVFLLLTFGTAQLALNNVAGILANVAVHQAARAAWVWMPEEAGRADSGTALEKSRVAAAMAMLPAAPGEYFLGPLDGDSEISERARIAAVASHIPGGGRLSNGVNRETVDAFVVANSQGRAGSRTFSNALGTSDFMSRTLKKFSFAYNATEVEIDEQTYEVTVRYAHYQGMPIVGRIFGTFQMIGPTLRPGYYATIERTYGLEKQRVLPNADLPDNTLGFEPSPNNFDDYYGGVE